MQLHGKNFIGGTLSAEGEGTFQARNPATREPLEPRFHEAQADEINRAAEMAALAFQERDGRSADRTAELLEHIAVEIEALGQPLLDRAEAETALPQPRLKLERVRTISQLRLFAGVVREGSWVDARIDRGDPQRRPVARPELRRMLVPIGPVAVFGASNFPLAFSTAGGDTASALAAGNPVVVKAHPAHPGTCEMMAVAIQKALADTGYPDDWFGMVHGVQKEVGLTLVRHPGIQAVAFTGSLAGGRALFHTAASREVPVPVYAEMGSVNPLFLLPAALAERAEAIARGLHGSVTLGCGQFCTKPGLVFAVAGEVLDRFLAQLAACFADGSPCTMLHGGILQAYESGIEDLSVKPGIELLSHSSPNPDPAGTQAAATLFAVDADTFMNDPEMAEEIFGPCTLVVRCETVEQMLEAACGLPGQLTATIHAGPADRPSLDALRSILEAKAGRLLHGGFPTGVEVAAAMHHGGPYPATCDSRSTSVGTAAILRFARPICYQDWPEEILPPELQNHNGRGILRQVDGVLTREDVVV
ncbi:MAG: aldehyde dehydrogenase (NADP(+)) [Thermoguttaceae bacterium]